jgi:hypothetical protein
MNAERPAGHVPEEREAKHQQANSDVRGTRPSLPENWRHADISVRTDSSISDLAILYSPTLAAKARRR